MVSKLPTLWVLKGVVGEGETGENRHPAGDLTQQGFDGGEIRPGSNYGGGGGGGAGAIGGDAKLIFCTPLTIAISYALPGS